MAYKWTFQWFEQTAESFFSIQKKKIKSFVADIALEIIIMIDYFGGNQQEQEKIVSAELIKCAIKICVGMPIKEGIDNWFFV